MKEILKYFLLRLKLQNNSSENYEYDDKMWNLLKNKKDGWLMIWTVQRERFRISHKSMMLRECSLLALCISLTPRKTVNTLPALVLSRIRTGFTSRHLAGILFRQAASRGERPSLNYSRDRTAQLTERIYVEVSTSRWNVLRLLTQRIWRRLNDVTYKWGKRK